MIISHFHKFVFVKTNKTAGSSLEDLLMRSLMPGDLITTGTTNEEEGSKLEKLKGRDILFLDGEKAIFEEGVFRGHSPLSQAHKYFPETREYFSFGVLRNPFTRMVSSFRWIKGKQIKELDKINNPQKYQNKLRFLFKNYVKQIRGRLNNRGRNLLQGLDETGNCWTASKIFQFEHMGAIQEELAKNCDLKIDIKDMPHFKSNTPRIPAEINLWSKDLVQIIKQNYQVEIDAFGYKDPEVYD